MRGALSTPLCLDNAITITASQFRGIRTVGAMNLDTAVDGDETEDGVTIDGRAATRQLIIDAFQIAVDDKHVIVHRHIQPSNLRLVEFELAGTTGHIVTRNDLLTLLQL